MAVHTTANLRRAARVFSWGALISAPVFALLGVGVLLGLGPAGGPSPVRVSGSAPAGQPVELQGRMTGQVVWGQPVGTDLSAVTCELRRSDGSSRDLPVGPAQGLPTQVVDVAGSGAWVGLAATEGQPAARWVVCAGGGLTTVGLSADPGGGGSASAWPFLLFAAVLLVAGIAMRSVGQPDPRTR